MSVIGDAAQHLVRELGMMGPWDKSMYVWVVDKDGTELLLCFPIWWMKEGQGEQQEGKSDRALAI